MAMDVGVFKAISAVVAFFVALLGGLLPLKVSNVSPKLMSFCNAFAGGILMAASLAHMLNDANGDLEEVGMKINCALGGDCEGVFPVGYALLFIGFFMVSFIGIVLDKYLEGTGHSHGDEGVAVPTTTSARTSLREQEHGHEQKEHGRHEHEGEERGSMISNTSTVSETVAAAVPGITALVALTVHGSIEGLAAGAATDMEQAGSIVLAICAHKAFAAFALSSTLLPLRQQGSGWGWIGGVVWFACVTPLAMLIGSIVAAALEGAAVAIVIALAAGSLLSIGVCEMLVPALTGEANNKLANTVAATVASLAMTLLAAWV